MIIDGYKARLTENAVQGPDGCVLEPGRTYFALAADSLDSSLMTVHVDDYWSVVSMTEENPEFGNATGWISPAIPCFMTAHAIKNFRMEVRLPDEGTIFMHERALLERLWYCRIMRDGGFTATHEWLWLTGSLHTALRLFIRIKLGEMKNDLGIFSRALSSAENAYSSHDASFLNDIRWEFYKRLYVTDDMDNRNGSYKGTVNIALDKFRNIIRRAGIRRGNRK